MSKNKYYPFTHYFNEGDGVGSLSLSEGDDMKWALFEAKGYLGNGHDWQRLVSKMMRATMPDIAKKLSYDSEAGMFSVVSNDEEALEKLSAFIANIINDDVQMLNMISLYATYD